MYKIRLPNFEGPFDLLLYFIKRDELNIYDIPISRITEEFLHYIRLIQYFDIELAGEFILMASTLMYIKAQMLLPVRKDDNEEEIEDPRTGLVQKLLEYKKYKDAALQLRQMAEEQKYFYYRNLFDADREMIESSQNYKNATLFDLLSAFKKATEKISIEEVKHIVQIESITVEEKTKLIIHLLQNNKRISFFELTLNSNRPHIVVTFLALLELMKYQRIYIFQENIFGDIIITQKMISNLLSG
jgi:segregation and condensation protein A